MITLECDKCKTKALWYSTEKLPDGWSTYEGNELCEKCTKNFHVFRKNLNELFDTKVKEYFK
ncbi:hypothetical protein LCGC14_2877060 [marine sediment metagenome]|uniref:Uncharacterized protein n=1 Tax=marine sediment metagenome TaxID=412755 RepID=A0A0F9A9A4_9ZZZZ